MIKPDYNAVVSVFKTVQDTITDYFNTINKQIYHEDLWDYPTGGGGRTRVYEGGEMLEKAGVNFSAIEGTNMPASAATQLKIPQDAHYQVTGVSLVIHPHNPHVPTIHMNIRYFQAGDIWWFGGGVDLTPYYPKRDQVIAFHQGVKAICDDAGAPYQRYKETCDNYFYLPHREETRGVGGVFFDRLNDDAEANLAFTTALGMGFVDLYRPFVEANAALPFDDAQRDFQLYRRGRYVEFNLLYDRGTKFGLESKGRIESILMSLPATANWRYNWHPEPGTPEYELTDVFLKPQDWVGMATEG